jgi:hypothetical protein
MCTWKMRKGLNGNIKMGSYGGRLWEWKMDRIDSESYPTVGFGISDFELLGPATSVLVKRESILCLSVLHYFD